VSEKFAGKQGPCPKCQTVITIPKLEEQVVVHAPPAEGTKRAAVDQKAFKPIARKETKVSALMMVAIGAGIMLVLGVALTLRFGLEDVPAGLLGVCACLLAPPLVWSGYAFLRDDELEAYRGNALALRVAICSVVYALMWGVYAWVPSLVLGVNQLELFHFLLLIPPIFVVGALAPLSTLDLDFGTGLIHFAWYVLITMVLCFIAGVDLVGAPPAQ